MAEIIVYYAYASKPLLSVKGNGVIKLSKILAIFGFGLLFYTYLPSVWYRIKPETVSYQPVPERSEPLVSEYQPRFDSKLSLGSRLIIPSIGVDTQIEEATYQNYEEALKNGVWRISNFGAPDESNVPTILVAHRFGYLAWSNIFRRKNSFYNLPKLKVGDTVEIVWRQRKYVYEIYAEDKGEEIKDYTASLILYTCQALTGPERIFKYAKLLEI